MTAPSRLATEGLGPRLRGLRRARGLTLLRLAALSGVPSSTISKIENGRLQPSLVNAIHLAMALGENLGFLVDGHRQPPQPRRVIRGKDRAAMAFDAMGLVLEDLGGASRPGSLEGRIGRLRAGADSGRDAMRHPGEEFAMILSGSIRYRIADTVHDLAAGDFIHFKADVRHRWINTHRGETTILWVFSGGLAF